MDLIETIALPVGGEERRIDLCVGDLTAIPPADAPDVLVVSAFPNDYQPTSGSLIGALDRAGISVARLAADKAIDLRSSCSCWLSREIPDRRSAGFGRVLCFEPRYRGRPPEVVGDIFRSLIPFTEGPEKIKTVAMPLVATGDAGESVSDMLPPLLDAAINWLTQGLALARLLIFVRAETLAKAHSYFVHAKEEFEEASSGADHRPSSADWHHDVFLSYAHADRDALDFVHGELLGLRPSLRVFVDRQDLDPGVAWQQEIYDTLETCRRVVALYSPSYLRSRMCKEEFNIARIRERRTGESILFPLYLYSSPLPAYMELVQYVDCREGDPSSLRSGCRRLVDRL